MKSNGQRRRAATKPATVRDAGVVAILLTTFETEGDAARVARAVVGEKLAACGTIIPAARSIYAWKGKIEDAREVMLILKTTPGANAKLARRVMKLHPYKTPEILTFMSLANNPEYASWLERWVT